MRTITIEQVMQVINTSEMTIANTFSDSESLEVISLKGTMGGNYKVYRGKKLVGTFGQPYPAMELYNSEVSKSTDKTETK